MVPYGASSVNALLKLELMILIVDISLRSGNAAWIPLLDAI